MDSSTPSNAAAAHADNNTKRPSFAPFLNVTSDTDAELTILKGGSNSDNKENVEAIAMACILPRMIYAAKKRTGCFLN